VKVELYRQLAKRRRSSAGALPIQLTSGTIHLEAAVPRGDCSKAGRPPFDHVFMFKVLILQAIHSRSNERCEYLIKDRLSFMRFLGLGLADTVPDANTIWGVGKRWRSSGSCKLDFFERGGRPVTGIIEMKIFAEFVGADGVLARRDVFVVRRNVDQPHLKVFGLTLEGGKVILQRVQAEQTQFQVEQCGMRDRECTGCERRRAIHYYYYRKRSIHTLFGICQVRAPRLRRCSCLAPHDTVPANRLMALMAGRTTPELERVQAELGARLSFREASRVLDLFVPAARPHNDKSVRNRLARVADQIETKDLSSPHRLSRVGPGPTSVFIDGAYVRAVPGFQTRHFEIIMGRVETDGHVARHFASAPNISTSDSDTIRAALRAQGWFPGRGITVFSDGDPPLRGALVCATRQQVTHILDWFHISMRVRHT